MSTKAEQEAKLKSQSSFGQKARSVVENEAYQFAMTVMRGEIFEKLESSDISGDNGEILEHVRTLQTLAKVQEQLEKTMAAGDFAQTHIEAEDNNQIRFIQK